MYVHTFDMIKFHIYFRRFICSINGVLAAWLRTVIVGKIQHKGWGVGTKATPSQKVYHKWLSTGRKKISQTLGQDKCSIVIYNQIQFFTFSALFLLVLCFLRKTKIWCWVDREEENLGQADECERIWRIILYKILKE